MTLEIRGDPRVPLIVTLSKLEFNDGIIKLSFKEIESFLKLNLEKNDYEKFFNYYTIKELINSLINDGVLTVDRNQNYFLFERKLKLFRMLIS
ncbi:MAG: hypothetical protein INQ03_06905 [Candidatus Heimdallarchaeota archaeon]|nr:hypothetical protein [Candidatus Heimdallarchaeota archaeon]